ncbi:spore coat protein [Chengkuizengella axinellae]|uniref:Spore coat protein n=1 Tax=Chengkuizengella axinellae TaxID=3064388 RepID=A0ABT9J2U3_9BACL|nr:spore coat protein [Chengkuizengella sp. 2205SS18-9]MDP5275936.1 spore coat protein [Chengkuizengella sp. 2205SS18-9]
MYNQSTSTMGQQMGQQHVALPDKDMANIVLSELKRMSREYTTACLEAANPMVHQTFNQLLQKSLADQMQLFQLMNQQGMYNVTAAPTQEIQKEQQKFRQCGFETQQFMQQYLGGGQTTAGMMGGQNAQPTSQATMNQMTSNYGMPSGMGTMPPGASSTTTSSNINASGNPQMRAGSGTSSGMSSGSGMSTQMSSTTQDHSKKYLI